MKKIFFIIVFLLFTFGCIKKEELNLTGKDLIRYNWIKNKTKENNLSLYYELEDGKKIYSYREQILYFDEFGKKHDLKKDLKNKKITIEDFVKKMDLYNASNDGGSIYLETKDTFFETKFYLAWCNSLEANGGIQDIFILENKEAVYQLCVIEDEQYYE